MGEKKKFAGLLAVLLVLLALLFCLRFINAGKEKRGEQEADSQAAVTDLGALKSISIQNGAEEIRLVKQEDAWVFSDEPEVKLDEDRVEELETEITSLRAVREFSHPDALEDYGLEDAAYTVQAADEAGNTCTIYVGNAANSEYYFTVDQKEKVCTGGSALVPILQYEKKQFVQNDTLPAIGTEKAKKITIDSPNTGKKQYTSKDEDAVSTILGGYGALSFGDCVAYNAKEDDLAGYGLDENSRITLKIVYEEEGDDEKEPEEKTFILYIGRADDTGTYRYVQVGGSRIVNQALTDTVSNLLNEKKDS